MIIIISPIEATFRAEKPMRPTAPRDGNTVTRIARVTQSLCHRGLFFLYDRVIHI